jgi:hypothetical protein
MVKKYADKCWKSYFGGVLSQIWVKKTLKSFSILDHFSHTKNYSGKTDWVNILKFSTQVICIDLHQIGNNSQSGHVK